MHVHSFITTILTIQAIQYSDTRILVNKDVAFNGVCAIQSAFAVLASHHGYNIVVRVTYIHT